jgi:prephenate dehydratase
MSADAAYQGARGAFSEEAARALLGPDVVLLPCRTLCDVFDALAAGRVRMAVVPLRNSIVGAVPHAAELMAEHKARVLAEHVQPINQTVIASPGATLDSIREVWSHPVALAQCTKWFARHPHARPSPAFDTAGAVADVLQRGNPREAAIASKRAADVYGGVVLAECVQDRADNVTEFVLITIPEAHRQDRPWSPVSPAPAPQGTPPSS